MLRLRSVRACFIGKHFGVSLANIWIAPDFEYHFKFSEVMRSKRRLTTVIWVSQNDTISTTRTTMPASTAKCMRVRLYAPPIVGVEFSGHYALSGRDLLMMIASTYTPLSTYTWACGQEFRCHTMVCRLTYSLCLSIVWADAITSTCYLCDSHHAFGD